MALSKQRQFVTPADDESVLQLAARGLPGEPLESAVARIKSWNLHILAIWRRGQAEQSPP
jgi:hypothetical protein